MKSTSSKRRKLTPKTTVDASDTVVPPNSRDGGPTTPSRASFMSPTKASLSRFNPSLIPRPRSAGLEVQKEFAHNVNQPLSPRRLNHLPLRPTTPTSAGARLSASPARPLSVSPTRRPQSIGGNLSAPARRRSRTPGRVFEPSIAMPTAQAQKISYDSAKQVHRHEEEQRSLSSAQAMPAEATREATGSFMVKNLSRAIGNEGDEPELPPTPEELGLETRPELPKGILSSSPTRRVTRRKAAMKRSPLKPQNESIQRAQVDVGRQRADSPQGQPSEAAKLSEAQRIGDQDQIDDPEQEKRQQLLEQLSNQRALLEQDVAILKKATENTSNSNQHILSADEGGKLLSILTTTNPSHKPNKAESKPVTTSNRLSLFLPFFKFQAYENPHLEQGPPASHHPLTLDDPLPHLSAFTPLNISSTSTLLASETDVPLMQRELKLTSPTSILKVGMTLVTDTVTQTVVSLHLSGISPWANAELGAWIRKQVSSGDVSSIGWACGRYWEAVSIRAKCWARCKARFPLLVPGQCRDQMEEPGPKAKNQKRTNDRTKKGSKAPTNERDVDEDVNERSFPASVSQSDVIANISSQSLLFSRSGISLLISWRIVFDWVGEAKSDVSAVASFPKTWRTADERGSLNKVGEAFDRLVRQRGVLDGIRIMVQLIFPDD